MKKHLAGFGLLTAFMLLGVSLVSANFTVNKTTDTNDGICDGDCSLREAVAAATASSGARIVDFAPALTGATIVLTAGEIAISKVKIIGPGAKYLTISGNNNSRIFLVTPTGGPALISGLTLTGGNGAGAAGSGDAGGGAIRVQGGGVILDGLNITLNTTSGLGGGVYLENGNIIRNSTFSQNTDNGLFFSALWIAFGSSTITNSTFASGNGIGFAKANVTARNITAPVGVVFRDTNASFSFGNSIIGSLRQVQPAGSIANSAGNNIVMNTTGSTGLVGFSPSDQQNVDPMLGALADLGGATPTMPLLSGSTAIDAGSNSLASAAGLLYDQRRYTRVADGNGDSNAIVDIGAYENLGVPANDTFVGGTVSDAAGNPVSRATVTITDMNGHTQTALTSPFGVYNFFNVAPGEVDISVDAKAHRASPVVFQALEGQTNTVNIAVQ